jgi:hypothetical protein
VLGRGLDLAADIGARDHVAGERLWHLLAAPFAVHLQNDHRMTTRVQLAWSIDWPRLCKETLAPMEPDVAFDPELLARRLRCYEATGDRRLAAAARHDLSQFEHQEPMKFGSGLVR